MTGYLGNDAFVFNTALNAANNLDTVTDFNHAADDLSRQRNPAQLGVNGPMNAGFFHNGAAAADANDYIVYDRVDRRAVRRLQRQRGGRSG